SRIDGAAPCRRFDRERFMTDEQPPAPPGEEPERYPFWDYSDIFLFAGLVLPCMLAGWGLLKAFLLVFRIHPALRLDELLPEQLLGYALLFALLALLLRVQYDRPFWRSLGWAPLRLPALWIAICGLLTSLSVAFLASLIHTPNKPNPITELLENRTSVLLMA